VGVITDADVMLSTSVEQPGQQDALSHQEKADTDDDDDDDVPVQLSTMDLPSDDSDHHYHHQQQQQPSLSLASGFPSTITVTSVTVTSGGQPVKTLQDHSDSVNAAEVFYQRYDPAAAAAAAASATAGKNVTPVKCMSPACTLFFRTYAIVITF